ncbi:MAG: DUF5069 domain-containing protein [Vampirovibrionales bacterium]
MFSAPLLPDPIPEPRSGGITLEGLPWLARMTDKARLQPTGALTILDLDYPCPMDQQLLRKLQLTGESFQALALALDDAALVTHLKAHGHWPV